MFIIELNPLQLAYLTRAMDRYKDIAGDEVMLHAQIRQQLQNPQLTEKVIEQITAKALQPGAPEVVQPTE